MSTDIRVSSSYICLHFKKAHLNTGTITNFPTLSSAVVDIWALQPQPHLQPRAALPSTSSRAASGETGSVRSTGGSSRPGTGDDAAAIPAQKQVAPVPKHWGEVVIPTRKGKKSRGFETAGNGGDVFGVLKVT